jgi:hypothetical protein
VIAKRVTPGVFELGDKKIVSVPNRDQIAQTSQIQNLSAGIDDETAEALGLTNALTADAAAAIDELANGDDLTAIKRRLAAQAITCDTIANKLMETGVLLSRNGATFESGLSCYRSATKMTECSRKALATLADIKKPRKTTFIKTQQNLAMMQADNGKAEQLAIEGNPNGRMDAGTKATGARTDDARQTVGVEYRACNN